VPARRPKPAEQPVRLVERLGELGKPTGAGGSWYFNRCTTHVHAPRAAI